MRIANTADGQFFYSNLTEIVGPELFEDAACQIKVDLDFKRAESNFIRLQDLSSFVSSQNKQLGLTIVLPDNLYGKYKGNGGVPKMEISSRAERTYLNIIGALLEYISGKSPGVQKHPDYVSNANMIDLFSSYDIPGLKKSTLEKKFADAKRTFDSEL